MEGSETSFDQAEELAVVDTVLFQSDFSNIQSASDQSGALQLQKLKILGKGEFGIVWEGNSLLFLPDVRSKTPAINRSSRLIACN